MRVATSFVLKASWKSYTHRKSSSVSSEVLLKQPVLDHGEDDAAEVLGAADVPVAKHCRRQHAVAVDREIAQPHAQLLGR